MNIQSINAELRQKFKRMSPEQFEQYIYELRRIYIKEHPNFRRMVEGEQEMKYLITNFHWDEQYIINNLRAIGYFVYALRNGEGEHYTVEPKVFVNNIGFIITDKPIKFHEEGSRQYITDVELAELGTEDISIKSALERAIEMEGDKE